MRSNDQGCFVVFLLNCPAFHALLFYFLAILCQSLFSGLGDIEQSVILGSNQSLKQEYINTLTSYLSPVLQPRYTGWKKCYQATVDDWEPSSFRVKCTYKGPTVTIVRYGNYILGGYTSYIWKREYQLLLPLLCLCQVHHADTFVTRPKETITCTYLLAISFYEGLRAYFLNQMFLCLFDFFGGKIYEIKFGPPYLLAVRLLATVLNPWVSTHLCLRLGRGRGIRLWLYTYMTHVYEGINQNN